MQADFRLVQPHSCSSRRATLSAAAASGFTGDWVFGGLSLGMPEVLVGAVTLPIRSWSACRKGA